MGFDLEGQEPKQKVGEYYRNNVWWWRPLWHLVCLECKFLTAKERKAGEYNDGVLIDSKTAVKIALKLRELIKEGKIKKHKEEYDEQMKSLPDEPCDICNATGLRDGKKCNSCKGVGKKRPFVTWYQFDEQNVSDFATFCANSGGFKIW